MAPYDYSSLPQLSETELVYLGQLLGSTRLNTKFTLTDAGNYVSARSGRSLDASLSDEMKDIGVLDEITQRKLIEHYYAAKNLMPSQARAPQAAAPAEPAAARPFVIESIADGTTVKPDETPETAAAPVLAI